MTPHFEQGFDARMGPPGTPTLEGFMLKSRVSMGLQIFKRSMNLDMGLFGVRIRPILRPEIVVVGGPSGPKQPPNPSNMVSRPTILDGL
jgi:hypothetical protein